MSQDSSGIPNIHPDAQDVTGEAGLRYFEQAYAHGSWTIPVHSAAELREICHDVIERVRAKHAGSPPPADDLLLALHGLTTNPTMNVGNDISLSSV